jgi:hypothetical protein
MFMFQQNTYFRGHLFYSALLRKITPRVLWTMNPSQCMSPIYTGSVTDKVITALEIGSGIGRKILPCLKTDFFPQKRSQTSDQVCYGSFGVAG